MPERSGARTRVLIVDDEPAMRKMIATVLRGAGATVITAASYRPLEVYTTIAVLYFVVLFPLTLVADQLENRLGAHR